MLLFVILQTTVLFHFCVVSVLVEGLTGPPGLQGIQGPKGEKGLDGVSLGGIEGVTGLKGQIWNSTFTILRDCKECFNGIFFWHQETRVPEEQQVLLIMASRDKRVPKAHQGPLA